MIGTLLTNGYGDLALGRRVRGPLDALPALIEDARYAIGLGEYGAVAEAEAEPEPDPQQSAVQLRRPAKYHVGHEVARYYAGEEHVAELTARGHYHRRMVEPVGMGEQVVVLFLNLSLSFLLCGT